MQTTVKTRSTAVEQKGVMGTLASLLSLAVFIPPAARLGNILLSHLFTLIFINIPHILIINAKTGRENILYSDSGRQFRKCVPFFALYFFCELLLTSSVFLIKPGDQYPTPPVLSDLLKQMANSLGQNLPLAMCLSWVYYLLVIVIKDKNVNPASFFVY